MNEYYKLFTFLQTWLIQKELCCRRSLSFSIRRLSSEAMHEEEFSSGERRRKSKKRGKTFLLVALAVVVVVLATAAWRIRKLPTKLFLLKLLLHAVPPPPPGQSRRTIYCPGVREIRLKASFGRKEVKICLFLHWTDVHSNSGNFSRRISRKWLVDNVRKLFSWSNMGLVREENKMEAKENPHCLCCRDTWWFSWLEQDLAGDGETSFWLLQKVQRDKSHPVITSSPSAIAKTTSITRGKSSNNGKNFLCQLGFMLRPRDLYKFIRLGRNIYTFFPKSAKIPVHSNSTNSNHATFALEKRRLLL